MVTHPTSLPVAPLRLSGRSARCPTSRCPHHCGRIRAPSRVPRRYRRAWTLAAAVIVACGSGGLSSIAAQDPLGPLVAEGLRNNLGLAQLRFADRASELEVRRARGLLLPTVAIDARYSELSGVIDLGEFMNPAYSTLNQLIGQPRFPTDVSVTLPFRQDMRVRLTQPLFDVAILASQSLARSQREVQRGRLGASARELAAGIQLAWLAHASASRVVELYETTLALVTENLRVSERLVASGAATSDAVSRARADLSEVRQQLADAVRRRNAAARAFNRLMARPLEAPVASIPDSLLRFPLTVTLDEALTRARAGREELHQAEWGIRAAEAQTQLASAPFLPSIALVADYGYQGDRLRFTGANDFAIGSLVVQWNLFNGGRDATRRAQARLDAERARTAREDLEARIALEVREAYEAAVVARDAIATAGERWEAARRTFELVRRRYEEGLAPHLEFVEARSAYTRAGLNEILTRYTYAARYVELERAAALRSLEP